MADKSELQHLPYLNTSSIAISKAQSGLIARGLKDATRLMTQLTESQLTDMVAVINDHADAKTQFDLGVRYNKGEGIEKNLEKAAQCFQKASDQGYQPAQLHLGMMFMEGSGLPKDHLKAEAWLQKAAEETEGQTRVELGTAWLAQIKLAALYSKGDPFIRNPQLSRSWWQRSQATHKKIFQNVDGSS